MLQVPVASKIHPTADELILQSRYEASGPDDLFGDLAEYLTEIGYNSSFLDKSDMPDPWRIITRMITDPFSAESKLFSQNIQEVIAFKEKYQSMKAKQDHKMSKKMRGNLDLMIQNMVQKLSGRSKSVGHHE